VDFSRDDEGQVLRRGAISVETLREIAPNLRDLTGQADESDEADGLEEIPEPDSGDVPAAGG
jgi:hypothetical protein